ncbi:ABC transporter permease [Rhodospirillum sp. A1_3_36]|uniref:ABC transporter permease n=1 Tax=Rhodospirillum sp. A1_3_36 TaxID=3391666 RepID=UPI0039A5724C
MKAILFRRVVQACLVALVVGGLTFILTHALPGNMAFRIAAMRYGYDMVDANAAEAVRQELGLDRSLIIAFLDWLWDLIRLDLGQSMVTGIPVLKEVLHEAGHTASLAVGAVLVSLVIGPPLGLLAGRRPGGWVDRISLLLATVLRTLPQFAIGLVLIVLLSVELGLFPAAGHGTLGHWVLPTLTLGLGLAAVSSRIARNAARDVARSPFFAFARVKGLSEREVWRLHGLRNAAVPVVTHLGIQMIYLIEGVIITETLFAWPGIGHAMVHAIVARDVPMIQGTALCLGLLFVLLNMAVDLACLTLDPRRRQA